jgi:ABC-type Fe3+/spermidine/putrescine transport system ATPase subunit
MARLLCESLTKSFRRKKVVDSVDIEVQGGEVLGLLGPNGAGKTTIFNLVCGVYRPSHGEIIIHGRNAVGLFPHQVTGLGIARTFQNIRLWPEMTVLDNIRVAHNYSLGYGLLHVLLQTSRYRTAEARIDRTAREVLEIMAQAAGVTPRFVEASRQEIEAAGIVRTFSPYAGPWASFLDPARAGHRSLGVDFTAVDPSTVFRGCLTGQLRRIESALRVRHSDARSDAQSNRTHRSARASAAASQSWPT